MVRPAWDRSFEPDGAEVMSTPAQKAANRRNAQKSTGPKSPEAKSRSRKNALKHGLTGEGQDLPPEVALNARLYERDLEAHYPPRTQSHRFAIRQAALAMARMDQAVRLEMAAREEDRTRAALAWEVDRAAEAAKLGANLRKKPELTRLKLLRTTQGVSWLIDQWRILLDVLDATNTWSDEQRELAADLLGVIPEFRSLESRIRKERTPEELRDLAESQIAELQERQENGLDELNKMDRALAVTGAAFEVSDDAWRIRRYEQSCWKKYQQAMKELEPLRRTPPRSSGAPRAERADRCEKADSIHSIKKDGTAEGSDSSEPDGEAAGAAVPEASTAHPPSSASAPETPAPSGSEPVAPPAPDASASASASETKRSQSTEDPFLQDIKKAAEQAVDPRARLMETLQGPEASASAPKRGMTRREQRKARRQAARAARKNR